MRNHIDLVHPDDDVPIEIKNADGDVNEDDDENLDQDEEQDDEQGQR